MRASRATIGLRHPVQPWLIASERRFLSLADEAVDGLSDQVGVSVVPGVLLDQAHHVTQD